jgi:hypothetical protein
MIVNPLLETWTTPFGPPPFSDRVRPEHFPPALDQGMAEHPRASVWISSALGWRAARLAESAEPGSDEVHPYETSRKQRVFVEAFGERILPAPRRR